MIVAAILVLAGVVLSVLFSVLAGLPSLSLAGRLSEVISMMLPYLSAGRSFLNTFCYASVVNVLLGITLVVEGIVLDYKVAMWVATKIPMFGVSD